MKKYVNLILYQTVPYGLTTQEWNGVVSSYSISKFLMRSVIRNNVFSM